MEESRIKSSANSRRLILDIAQYIVLRPLFSRKTCLIKMFKNFEDQVKGFLNVTGDSLAKNSAIHLKYIKTIKLKYFKVLKIGVNT